MKSLAAKIEKLHKVPTNEISEIISKNLKGYVTDRYVRMCLPDKYKNPIQQSHAILDKALKDYVKEQEQGQEQEISGNISANTSNTNL